MSMGMSWRGTWTTHCSTESAPREFVYAPTNPVSHTDSGVHGPVATLGAIRLFLSGIASSVPIACTAMPNSLKKSVWEYVAGRLPWLWG